MTGQMSKIKVMSVAQERTDPNGHRVRSDLQPVLIVSHKLKINKFVLVQPDYHALCIIFIYFKNIVVVRDLVIALCPSLSQHIILS